MDLSLGHDHHRVGHGQGLLLVVGDKDEGDARLLLDLFQFHLHVLAQLQVQGPQGLVQQQDLGAGHQGPGDGHPLLLAAGQAGDSAVFKTAQGHQREHLVDLGLNLPLGHLLLPKGEGHVFKDVQMGEEGILLKNSVDVPFVGGHVVDFLAQKEDIALIRGLKAADEPEHGGLSAARGAQQGDKLVVIDVQVDVLEHRLPVKGFGDVFQLDDFFHTRPSQKHKKSDCTPAAYSHLEKLHKASLGRGEEGGESGDESLYSKETYFYYSY